MEYNEDEYLLLSGLQHFRFCRRQWTLIHVENQWAENGRTADGAIMHQKAHDAGSKERRGDLLITRDMHVFSPMLSISGACDVVEFRRSDAGVPLHGQEGLYQPFPVEYKSGSPRGDTVNALQLCAQAMCMEEMLCCDIPEGALYYGEIRRRETVELTRELRREVRDCLAEMHALYERGHTPRVKPTKAWNACSLKELCLPKLLRGGSASGYVKAKLEEL